MCVTRPAALTGGLVSWDGIRWGIVGGAALDGSVSTCLVAKGHLYIAGDFRRVGALAAHGLASYDTRLGVWSAPAGAVRGGTVNAMLWWQDSLVIAGSFTEVGGHVGAPSEGRAPVKASGLARWIDDKWLTMGSIKGSVFSLACSDSTCSADGLYVAGSFSSMDGAPVPLLARFKNGRLEPVNASGAAPTFGRCIACHSLQIPATGILATTLHRFLRFCVFCVFIASVSYLSNSWQYTQHLYDGLRSGDAVSLCWWRLFVNKLFVCAWLQHLRPAWQQSSQSLPRAVS